MSNPSILDSSARHTYWRLVRALRPYRWLFAIGIIGTIFASLTDAGLAWAIKPLINKGFIDRDQAFIKWLPLAIILIFLSRGLTGFVSSYFITKVGRNVVTDFRQQIFAHILKLPAQYIDRQTSGQLLSLIIFNSEQVAEASTFALLTMVQEGFLVLGLLGVMFMINWQLTLLFIVTAPVISIVIRYTSKRLRILSRNVQDSMAEVTHVAEETIEGYRVVRTFGGEGYERKKFNFATNNNRQRELKVVVTNTLGTSGVQLLAAIPIALTLFLATSTMMSVSAGSFAAIIAAMLSLLRPMRRLTRVNSMLQKGIAGAQSVFDLLDKPTEWDRGNHACGRINGEIVFNNVCLSYFERDGNVLQNISFRVNPGETVALVGRSGAGKSSLVSLLPRFYDVTAGQLLIDGVDIREYRLDDLRKQFALVSQDVCLFNDSIARNIAYGQFDPLDLDAIRHAAKMSHALDFIEKLPQGFDTVIGENGVLLSGGQRQRIAIARALLKDAPILILDEATSALDTESERAIQAALDQLMVERTTIVIAHRLSTIENADRILVLDGGRLVESGTHFELLAREGYYAKLHALQFSNEEAIA